MKEFRSPSPMGDCAQGTRENAAFCYALAAYALKNVSALADSIVAAVCSAGETNTYLFNSATEDVGERIAAAAAFTSFVAPGDLLTAHAEFARRAIERYAANARALRVTAIAGARACREPLLERLS